jgi:hypothetical protein
MKHKTRPIRVWVSLALSIAFVSLSASLERLSAQDLKSTCSFRCRIDILGEDTMPPVECQGEAAVDHLADLFRSQASKRLTARR